MRFKKKTNTLTCVTRFHDFVKKFCRKRDKFPEQFFFLNQKKGGFLSNFPQKLS